MIGVPPVIDVEDMNLAELVVDAISGTIFTAPGAPQALERSVQRRADTMRFSTQRAADELPSRECGAGWEAVAQCLSRAGCKDYPVWFGLVVAAPSFLLMRLFHEPAVVP
jgi:hypothetical protein